MQKLREFFTSSSGLAPARQGLALGWVISVLTGITVLLGAKEAKAGDGSCPGQRTDCSWHAGCAEVYPDKPFRCCTKWLDDECNVINVTSCSCVA